MLVVLADRTLTLQSVKPWCCDYMLQFWNQARRVKGEADFEGSIVISWGQLAEFGDIGAVQLSVRFCNAAGRRLAAFQERVLLRELVCVIAGNADGSHIGRHVCLLGGSVGDIRVAKFLWLKKVRGWFNFYVEKCGFRVISGAGWVEGKELFWKTENYRAFLDTAGPSLRQILIKWSICCLKQVVQWNKNLASEAMGSITLRPKIWVCPAKPFIKAVDLPTLESNFFLNAGTPIFCRFWVSLLYSTLLSGKK